MAKTNITLGVSITNCSECNKLNIGAKIYDAFCWRPNTLLVGYKAETKQILVSKSKLMRLIQLANPEQPYRDIKLVD